MASNKDLPKYTKGEEIFNSVTHIIGGSFGVVALVLLIIIGTQENLDPYGMISVIVYGISMIMLYTMSSIYHFLRPNRAKKLFRIFDHCTIYLLIAGTYTPICVIIMRDNVWGIILLSIVWICLVIGVVMNAINMHNKVVKIISMILYFVMGWCAIFALKPVLDVMGWSGFGWILGGGVAYTLGIIFFALGMKIKYTHSIWHIFVLLGTIIQFIGILFYVVM